MPCIEPLQPLPPPARAGAAIAGPPSRAQASQHKRAAKINLGHVVTRSTSRARSLQKHDCKARLSVYFYKEIYAGLASQCLALQIGTSAAAGRFSDVRFGGIAGLLQRQIRAPDAELADRKGSSSLWMLVKGVSKASSAMVWSAYTTQLDKFHART